ncbi:MAG TPA: helix-turn-helix domain-containing protein [Chryseosolibacter sp.]
MDQELCKRLRYKLTVLSEISLYAPEHRIHTLLRYITEKLKGEKTDEKIMMPYTREQLAGMTGLSLGTVIRTVRKMAREGKVVLEGHKICLQKHNGYPAKPTDRPVQRCAKQR